jgi:mycofactocin precursor
VPILNDIDEFQGGSEKLVEFSESINQSPKQLEENGLEESIFSVEEITLEEMAIDGICGVY